MQQSNPELQMFQILTPSCLKFPQLRHSFQWWIFLMLSSSVPVLPESQFWFAFNFNGRGYTFTRLCQGYCESPTIYNEALKQSLESLVLSPENALLQYVDDLMICSPTKEQCESNTVKLLKHLAKSGHKAS